MKRFFLGGWLVIFLSIVTAGSFFMAAHAAAAQYTLYYSDSDKETLKKIFEDGEKQQEIGEKMVVAAKGGLFGDGYNLVFSPAVNNQLNNDPGGDDDSDEYFAVAPVYCKGDTISLEEPTDKPYFAIDYVLGYRFDKWKDVETATGTPKTYKTYAGITKVTKVADGGIANEVVHIKKSSTGTKDLGDDDANGTAEITSVGQGERGQGKKISELGISSTCLGALTRGDLGQKTQSYWGLTEDQRTEIDTIVNESPTADVSGSSGSTGDSADTCRGGALGWVLCPIIEGFTAGIKGAAAIIESMLTFRVLADTNGDNKIKPIHEAFVGIANVVLILAFLYVIYAQTTSAGMSNYSIKKALPRIVLGAIFINLSYYICALLIDFSNIAGNSIIGFMVGSGGGSNTIASQINASVGNGGVDFFSTAGDVAAGTAVGGGLLAGGVAAFAIGASALLWLVVPLLLGVLVSMFTVLILLIARQVIILALVLVSPIAFAAWLLPNTEQYFKKWWQLFSQQLILFPMLMGVFGAAILAASLIG